jgi:uncharacterized DUF497 family protein
MSNLTIVSDDSRFEWDEKKASTNIVKHGIAFCEILPVFDDPYIMEYYDDTHSTIEENRIICLGMLQDILVIFVCYVERGARIRIISARKARPREEAKYYEQITTIP